MIQQQWVWNPTRYPTLQYCRCLSPPELEHPCIYGGQTRLLDALWMPIQKLQLAWQWTHFTDIISLKLLRCVRRFSGTQGDGTCTVPSLNMHSFLQFWFGLTASSHISHLVHDSMNSTTPLIPTVHYMHGVRHFQPLWMAASSLQETHKETHTRSSDTAHGPRK